MAYQKERVISGYRVDLLKREEGQPKPANVEVHQVIRRDLNGESVYMVAYHTSTLRKGRIPEKQRIPLLHKDTCLFR